MNDVTSEILRNQLVEANTLINQAINLELSYINTNHPDFIGLGLLLNRPDPEGNLIFFFFNFFFIFIRFLSYFYSF